jgi:hypothetical protein
LSSFLIWIFPTQAKSSIINLVKFIHRYSTHLQPCVFSFPFFACGFSAILIFLFDPEAHSSLPVDPIYLSYQHLGCSKYKKKKVGSKTIRWTVVIGMSIAEPIYLCGFSCAFSPF